MASCLFNGRASFAGCRWRPRSIGALALIGLAELVDDPLHAEFSTKQQRELARPALMAS